MSASFKHLLNGRVAGPALSKRKRFVFSLVTFLVIWLFVDTGAYFFLKAVRTHIGIFYGLKPPTDEQLEVFARTEFDPVLGWDLPKRVERGPLGEKKGHPYSLQPRYKAKAFGDSFTQGVRDPKNTFEYAVEEQTSWQFLNYGVSGYGPDQATLKYQANRVSTEYTFLGIPDENIGRIVNSLRGFFTLEESFRVKPRFIVRDDSRIVLLPNPIQDVEDLPKLKDPVFVENLRRYDYWSNYYQDLHAPYELRWPATAVILPHLDFFASQSIRLLRHAVRPTYETNLWRSRHYHLYEPGSEGLRILRYVVDEFAATAKARSEVPVVLVFAGIETMEIMTQYKRKPYQTLIDHLEQTGIEFIDAGDIFLHEGNFPRFYIPGDRHLNPDGNRKVAEEIVRRIRALDERRTGSKTH